jgi:hypothetical protein
VPPTAPSDNAVVAAAPAPARVVTFAATLDFRPLAAAASPLQATYAVPAIADSPSRPAPANGTAGLAASTGSSSGGGFSPSLFLALLVALASLACLLSERLRLPSIVWRPAVFVSLQERPG